MGKVINTAQAFSRISMEHNVHMLQRNAAAHYANARWWTENYVPQGYWCYAKHAQQIARAHGKLAMCELNKLLKVKS